MGVRSCLRGCLRRCAGKSSLDGNLPKYVKPPTAIFQICSKPAFGLASPPVSLKPPRPRPLPGVRNESTAFAESLRAVECVPGRKKALGALYNSLSARSLGMVERLIPNSEQCALCQSGRAKVAAVGCRGQHPLVNARKCGATCVGVCVPTRPDPLHSRSF